MGLSAFEVGLTKAGPSQHALCLTSGKFHQSRLGTMHALIVKPTLAFHREVHNLPSTLERSTHPSCTSAIPSRPCPLKDGDDGVTCQPSKLPYFSKNRPKTLTFANRRHFSILRGTEDGTTYRAVVGQPSVVRLTSMSELGALQVDGPLPRISALLSTRTGRPPVSPFKTGSKTRPKTTCVAIIHHPIYRSVH